MQCARAWRAVRPLRAGWNQTRSYAPAARLDLSGIYPPIATPFTTTEDVDYQKLEDNLRKYAKMPLKGQARGARHHPEPQVPKVDLVKVKHICEHQGHF